MCPATDLTGVDPTLRVDQLPVKAFAVQLDHELDLGVIVHVDAAASALVFDGVSVGDKDVSILLYGAAEAGELITLFASKLGPHGHEVIGLRVNPNHWKWIGPKFLDC